MSVRARIDGRRPDRVPPPAFQSSTARPSRKVVPIAITSALHPPYLVALRATIPAGDGTGHSTLAPVAGRPFADQQRRPASRAAPVEVRGRGDPSAQGPGDSAPERDGK